MKLQLIERSFISVNSMKKSTLFGGQHTPMFVLLRLLQSLQTLKLLGCGNLEGLPRDTLLIFDCENLISLPKDVGCLSALETLVISGCTKLTMPKDEDDQVNKLSLRRLKLPHLPEMVALPRWLQGCEDTLQFL
ncbi:hypothetical protein TIFTF001_046697 [Ficus carica]|uniref:CC-NBS-LRR protein n=1 Tax=Ficus carica TaxID=3494 RepID=A0AA87ZAI9_FICCA|nr:hypothetical protein TIFTF001_046697 [Ficus carica]